MASGNTLFPFLPQMAEWPSSSYGALDTRNNHPVVDLASGESVIFSGILPQHYAGGGITVYLHYAMSTATTNAIALETCFERIGEGSQDMDADSFASAKSTGDVTVPGTSGNVDITSTAHSNSELDGLLVGEIFRLKVGRVAPGGSAASGDLELRGVELREA